MVSSAELSAMRQAIILSGFGIGTTSPNPPVGCVILDRDNNDVGHAYHERKGEAHAERRALEMAGERAREGTAVVTLEPCNHQGRTPACRQALLDAGIARCVIAVLDPTSREEGGAQRLRTAGVDVATGVLAEEARLVLGSWLHALTRQRPFVTWVYAVDAAGKVVAPGEAAEVGYQERADAVIRSDGSIAEAVPGTHGDGILELDVVQAQSSPERLLGDLYRAGVRTLVLFMDLPGVEPYLDAGLVDRAVASIRPGNAPYVPESFQLGRICHAGANTVIVEAEAT